MGLQVRLAVESDLPLLPDIERSAAQAFRKLGMDRISDEPPSPVAFHRDVLEKGVLWVAEKPPALLVGFLAMTRVDGEAHIKEISVAEDHARQGVGRELMAAAIDWARREGFPSVTLTTFQAVAMNGPFYRSLGFREMPADHMGPELASIRRKEGDRGLDEWPRVAMRLALR